jgi:hypothetical protein
MNAPKRGLDTRSIVSYAYANQATPRWKKQERPSVPGPLYDLFWVGALLILVVGYFA